MVNKDYYKTAHGERFLISRKIRNKWRDGILYVNWNRVV